METVVFTERLTESIGLPANPAHAATRSASFNTNSVNLRQFRRALWIIDVGTISAGTLDAKVQESPDSSSWFDLVPAVAITQITAGSVTVTVEVRSDQLTSGRRFVRLALTLGGGPSMVMAVITLAAEPDQRPAKQFDAGQITERVVA